MKTTWDLPAELHAQLRKRAAAEGRPMRALVVEALRRHCHPDGGNAPAGPPWRKFFGVVSPEEMAEIDAAVREYCEQNFD